jgi:uncharacterized membrane protein YgcG
VSSELAVLRHSVDDFSFESYTADYYLSRADDGTSQLQTVETFVAQFPDFDQNRGILRAIPLDYDGVELSPEVESVVDASGESVPFEEDTDGGFLVLALGTDDYVQGEQTYTITYSQQNVVRSFDDTNSDEFYWDTNGTGFSQPFGSVTARVHVEAELEGALSGNTACYVGAQGSTDTCTITQEADASGPLFTATAADLSAGENVSVAIGFDQGTFVVPDPPQRALWSTIVAAILITLAVIAVIAAIIDRVRLHRGHRGRGTIIPQYSVPTDLNLLTAGDLVGRQKSALAAEFVSLAVRGNIMISELDDDYRLHYIDSEGVDEREKELLTVLFGKKPKPGAVKRLGKASNKFAAAVKKILAHAESDNITNGLRVKRHSPIARAMAGLLTALTVASILLFVIDLIVSPVPNVFGFVAILVTLFCVIGGVACAVPFTVATEAGAERRDYIEGLRMYLALAEADRFKMLQSPDGALRSAGADDSEIVKLYEKLLPYAVLWGVEEEWAKELAVAYHDTQPEWYSGSSGFNPVAFGVAMHAFSASSATTATPAYSSSSGGSFSGGSMGGGFSGGGGGGGGGGGR